MLEVVDATKESEDLLPTRNDGETPLGSRVGNLLDVPGLLQGDLVEEPKSGDVVAEPPARDLRLVDQVDQEGPDFLRPQLIGGTAEVLGELGYEVQVVLLRGGGEVPDLQILDHLAAQRGHGNLLGSDVARDPWGRAQASPGGTSSGRRVQAG